MLQVQVLSPVLSPPCNSRAWICRRPRAPKLRTPQRNGMRSPRRRCHHGPAGGTRPGRQPWSIFHAPAGLRSGRCVWGLSSAGRASAWLAEGRRFETVRLHKKRGSVSPLGATAERDGSRWPGGGTIASSRASGGVQLSGRLPHLPGWPEIVGECDPWLVPRQGAPPDEFVPPPNVSRVTPFATRLVTAPGGPGKAAARTSFAHRARQVEHRSEDPGVLGSTPRQGTMPP
jgi:hypothetical protein